MTAIYEERRAVVQRGAWPEYRRLMLESVWPALAGDGARPLCLLNGLIGMPVEETYTFVGFPDIAHWQRSQAALDEPPRADVSLTALHDAFSQRAGLIDEEQTRLLLPSESRPKPETLPEDRRPVYGLRRFTIHPRDWPEFVRLSAEGVWLRIEAQDARILGLYRDAAATDPLEVTLITGYHGPGHWEETRFWRDRPADFPEDLWELGRRNVAARGALTLRSHVCLMAAHWPG